MKYLLIAFLALSSAGFANASPILVPDTVASFEAPAGFTPLTKNEIDAKYPGSAPAHVIGNASRTITIAFELKPFPFTDAELPQVMEGASSAMQNSLPGLTWVDRKLIELDGQRWIYLESTYRTAGRDTHDFLVATPYAGKALFLEFSATSDAFATAEAVLRASLDSIRLNGVQQPTGATGAL